MCSRTLLTFSLMLLTSLGCFSQVSGESVFLLNDLKGFEHSSSSDWRIVSKVQMLSHPIASTKYHSQALAKKGKKRFNHEGPGTYNEIEISEGVGILLFSSDTSRRSENLATRFLHRDLKIEFDVMFSQKSELTLFLQGSYGISLTDSWVSSQITPSTLGGIKAADTISQGKAPRHNVARAPGLWQRVSINFKAPRFASSGGKISNAIIESVTINGIGIQNQIELSACSQGALNHEEVNAGPLVFSGHSGSIAFRNISYSLTEDVDISFGQFLFKAFKGNFGTIKDFESANPSKQGSSKELTCLVSDTDNEYGIIFSSTITVPIADTYYFNLQYTGGGQLSVNGTVLTDYQRGDAARSDNGKIFLPPGTYPIQIVNYKNVWWEPPRLALFVKTANSNPIAAHSFESFPTNDNPVAAMSLNAGSKVRLLRGFIDYESNAKQRLTHTIGVGDPNGTNYIYDLTRGNLVGIWRGPFADVTPMWYERGDGSFRPAGDIQFLGASCPLAFLRSVSDSFPSGNQSSVIPKGYRIIDKIGRPEFLFHYKDLIVRDKVYSDSLTRSIIHEVNLNERGVKPGLYYRLASGNTLSLLPNGTYSVDQKYYIKVFGDQPIIRESAGRKELLLEFSRKSIRYSITW